MAVEIVGERRLDLEALPSRFDYSPAAMFLAAIPGAVSISSEEDTTHKSGAKSPIYIDNRTFWGHLEMMLSVTWMFKQKLEDAVGTSNVDTLCGVASAGIPHAIFLAHSTQLPGMYVDDGTVQGRLNQGDRVLVVEDHASTGGSILATVDVLRKHGAVVEWAFAISSYNAEKVRERLAKEGVKLVVLCDLPAILNACARRGSITCLEYVTALEWYKSL